MNHLISVREIDSAQHMTNKYIMIYIYILRTLSSNEVTVVHIHQKVHIIDNLKVKLLMKINILMSEKVVVDFNN